MRKKQSAQEIDDERERKKKERWAKENHRKNENRDRHLGYK